MKTLIFRYDTVKSTIASGSPLSHLDKTRPVLERHSKLSLTASSHLAQEFVPFLSEEECDFIQGEFGGSKQPVMIINDATGVRNMEHTCCILRGVLEDPEEKVPPRVIQRLAELRITTQTHNGMRLAGLLHSVATKVRHVTH